MTLDKLAFASIYRQEVGRCTATLIGVLGDVDLAEDAVADAFERATYRWATDGIPPNPGGWITTTAKNLAIDRLRRESTRDARERQATELFENDGDEPGGVDVGELTVVTDDQLRLIFLCCHPALGPDVQVALTLRLLAGLTTKQIARAFLVPEATMAQRLTRAKRKIRSANMAYRLPEPGELTLRLTPVLGTIYLIFSEGHNATAGLELQRSELTSEAVRLGRTVVDLLPEEPEAVGLLALMLLTQARSPARIGADGQIIPLADQDRTLWNPALIAEGHDLIRWCIRLDKPGPYQLQAAIAAVHADAPSAAETDWSQIVASYDQLLSIRPTPIVALNRAIAVMELHGPEAALDALADIDLPNYHLYHAAQAEALDRLGRSPEAARSLRRAIALTSNATEVRHLEGRLARL